MADRRYVTDVELVRATVSAVSALGRLSSADSVSTVRTPCAASRCHTQNRRSMV